MRKSMADREVNAQQTDLEPIDPERFAVYNAQRLMVKFYRGVF